MRKSEAEVMGYLASRLSKLTRRKVALPHANKTIRLQDGMETRA